MAFLRNLPLKWKLTLVIAMTNVVAMLLGGAASLSYEFARYRQNVLRDMAREAEIVGANSGPALAAGDREAAQRSLASLRGRREVVTARLFDREGRLFAEHVRAGADVPPSKRPASTSGHAFERGYARLWRPVMVGDHVVGTVTLRADLREERARAESYAVIAVVVMLASMLAALLVSRRMQRMISDPILSLASFVRLVREREDYTLRASRVSGDETGELAGGVNQMLGQIEQRTAELRASEERFRQMADSIREVFWLTNPEKNQILFVSSAYEEIWGRPCASLYAEPGGWLEAICPADRERVRKAALENQVTGTYDEEYRIVRPDGQIRRIRNRAYPVRDQEGRVYRVAGVAEDVTERRNLERQLLRISDREQSRIGQDLHDVLCQRLAGIGFKANSLKLDLETRSPAEAGAAQHIAHELSEAVAQARQLARGLYPLNLQSEGLAGVFGELAQNTGRDFEVDCVAECAEGVSPQDQAVATNLYRIAQEAVHNAVKHARASRIVIRLEAEDHRLRLSVADNGIGIGAVRAGRRGMGLALMKYRADMIGGSFDIQPVENGGTAVCCSIPQTCNEPEECHECQKASLLNAN